MKAHIRSAACCVLLALAWAGPSAADSKVTLYRDTWGVPHVYADTLADAAYGMGYAQAEDRLEDIYANIRTAVGSLAEVLGPQFVERDYIMRLVGNAERCEAYWKTAPPEVMDVGTREEPEGSGRFVAHDRSSSTMVSFMRPDGVESYSIVNWGQSGDPNSPHHVDQAEKLYAERKFKPTWFKKEELLKNLESEKTLTIE